LLLSSALPAAAADPDFCHDYAATAMRQIHAEMGSPNCAGFVANDPDRWRPDFDRHFDWCMRKSHHEVDKERDARSRILDQCVGGDWRHDDRWSHDGDHWDHGGGHY
jgi:hypothetical protein